jgi:aspartyl protease family protein
MWRVAILIIFVGTLVGGLMPSSAPTSTDDPQKVILVEPSRRGERSPQASDPGSDTITLERNFDGHFYVDAQVNGATVHFLIDTGASGIALSSDDARRAGLAFNAANAEVIGSGASGAVMGHWVELNRVQLGPKSVSNTPAVILEGGDRSLLGQSFLSQFGSLEIHHDIMVLR